jgi:MOSC domain-containing protein YiiM
MQGRIVQINVSAGGVPKKPILTATVGPLGIVGDDHANPQFHGGPRKALLLIASEVIQTLQAEGWPLFHGALGENLTTSGLDHKSWRPGMRFRVGEAEIELTTPRHPCATLNPYGRGIQKRIFDELVKAGDPRSPRWGEAGFYASVQRGGNIRNGDIIEMLDPIETGPWPSS